jgi:hypothetical protein
MTTRYAGALAAMAGALVAVGLLVLIMLMARPRPVEASSSGQNDLDAGPSWSTVASGAHLTRPSAIATIARNDIWVVGSVSDAVGEVRTGAEHWDGSSWSRVIVPDVGTGGGMLNGVDASGGNNVWAVGYSSSGREKTHKMPSSTSLGSRQGRPLPSARRGGSGIKSSRISHCSSVRSTSVLRLR